MLEKRYDFTAIENEMQKFWEENNIYSFNESDSGEIYSIDTPPPTVSGSLHIGHIFSYVQAEMIARFRRMQGYNVFYPFGFDDNGLPTERLVEREEKIQAKDLIRSEFIKKCVTTTTKYEAEFTDLWKSLGFSCDWSKQYTTVSPKVQYVSQYSFLDLVKKNKAYMKESPVLWCTECRTSIAQAELETVEIESAFNYIPFVSGGTEILVATTRPELLCAVVCLFVNPADERYKGFIGKTAIVPLYNFEVPILADEKVSTEKGTGAVMCATYGDGTDVEWCAEYGLPYKKAILSDGCMDIDVPYIAGLSVHAARSKIINLLDENGLLIKSEKITHMVAAHERCGKEVELIPSRQWYIDVLSEKERLLKAADEINWYPAQMKNRYTVWVENLKWDWCISRQRYFGVPFPVWYCRECGKPHFAEPSELPVNPVETKPDIVCSCGCEDYIPETAVFDTWATSSVTPFINSGYNIEKGFSDKLLPMSMRTQAHEIIRTWAFYTIVKSLYHTGKLPWKDIMICGFVLAKKGEKISKSKNNSELSPPYLIKTHSADALRYWAASSRLGTDTYFSPEELPVAKRFITKLWNASKFALTHLEDVDLSYQPNYMPVDRWIIEKTKLAVSEARELLNQYETGAARHVIDELFWKDFCDNYLEIVKERLYQPEVHGAENRKSGQSALYYGLLNILKLYSIYVPHITEYIYQCFFKQHEKAVSIHLLKWEKADNPDMLYINFGEALKDIVSDMRKYKTENGLSMRAEMNELVITAIPQHMDLFMETEKDIIACSQAKKIILIKG